MRAPFLLEALGAAHNRDSFSCGRVELDRYLRTQATQDIRRKVAVCFVAVEAETGQLAGFYTIAAASIPFVDLPTEITKRLPRYPALPAVRIGRLAVDERFRGRGLAGALLADALRRVLLAPPAVYALVVDAKDDEAVAFYRHHGFESFISQPRSLLLPVETAAKILKW
ncbi:MAG: GNAT family N-acetyltransferase [Bryobacteraceae bacterium]